MPFWQDQPVQRRSERLLLHGPIASIQPDDQPTPLPTGLGWTTLDGEDPRIAVLLRENAPTVEPAAALRWRLSRQDVLGIHDGGQLVGIISAVPVRIRLRGQVLSMVEVNTLCLSATQQGQGRAALLIQELIRQQRNRGVQQALFCTSHPIPACPLAQLPVFLRVLDATALQQAGWDVHPDPPFPVPAVPLEDGTRADVPAVHGLLRRRQQGAVLCGVRSEDEVAFRLATPETRTLLQRRHGQIVAAVQVCYRWQGGVRLARCGLLVCCGGDPVALMQGAIQAAQRDGAALLEVVGMAGLRPALRGAGLWDGGGRCRIYLYNWRCSPLDASQVVLFPST